MHDKAFDIAKNPKYDGYQKGLATMVYKFFGKITFATRARSESLATQNKFAGGTIKNENMSYKKLAKYTSQLLQKFNKIKVHSSFIDNICGADLPDLQLISRFNKRIRFLLCVIDIFSKYAWVILLNNKKGITISNTFQKILDESNRKKNKMRVDKGNKFYNRSMMS